MTAVQDVVDQVVETSQCRISYQEVGSGPLMVCLHGGGPGVAGWSNFAANAAAFSSDFRVVTPDLPGFGASTITDDPGGPWGALAARAVIDLIDHLGGGPAFLLGNSLGGSIAVKAANLSPSHVGKLVLMGAAGLSTSYFTPAPMEGVKHLQRYYLGDGPSLEKMRALMDIFVFDTHGMPLDELARTRYERSILPGVPEGYKRVYDHAHHSISLTTADLEQIAAETLIIWGKDDRCVGVDKALVFTEHIPDNHLLLLPKCGHWAQVERPVEFNRYVRAFLGAD